MIANWRLPPGFFREGFFLGVTLVGCGVKLVFWIAREACGSKRPVFDIPLAEYQRLACLLGLAETQNASMQGPTGMWREGKKEINLIS